MGEHHDLLGDVAAERVAGVALEEADHVGVTREYLVEETQPGWRPAFGVIGHRSLPGVKRLSVVWPEIASTEVDRAVLDVQGPGVGVELVDEHWDAGLRCGQLHHGPQAGG